MAVDSVTPGYAQFQGFDLTTNFHQYLKVFDQLLAYDFDTFVGGHLTSIGTKRDVEIAKEYTLDVYNTVKRIHNTWIRPPCVANAVKTIGTDENEFLLFKVLLDKVTGRRGQGASTPLDSSPGRGRRLVAEPRAHRPHFCSMG